jgi:PAS domain S-box-containing protein
MIKDQDTGFLKIFNNSLVGLILTNEDHIIININDHLLELAELDRQDVIGKTGLELGILSEDFVKNTWEEFTKNEKLVGREFSFKTKSNQLIYCLFSTERIELDGSKCWLTTIIDISKRKRSEKELANIYERVTDAFVAIDNNWVYTYVNKKAGELLEKDPQNQVGKNNKTKNPEDIGQQV